MSKNIIFTDVPVGRQFVAPSGVQYKKINNVSAKAIRDANGHSISNGETTVKFYKTNIVLLSYTG